MATMKPQAIEDVKAILDSLPTKYAALAALGITTGGRIRELLSLRRIDLIDPARLELRDEIKIIKLKSRRRSTAAKLDELKGMLEEAAAPHNMYGQRLDHPDTKQTRKKPESPQYRHFTIHPGIKGYISAHLNEEARNGHVRPSDFVFRGHNAEKPMHPEAAYNMFSRKLGPGYGTHWMRKTYAAFMYETFREKYHGDTYKALKEVQRLLGHKFLDSTAHYLQIESAGQEETIKEAFDKVF